MKRLGLGCAVVSILVAAAAQADGPVRVALVHGSFGNFRHRDDYDGVMKTLGWKLDKFENKDFARLAGQLDNYDLVLGTALYNYAENVQDFSVYREALLAFMRRGGAIIWTDTNYPTHVNWLAKWGADWAVSLRPPESGAKPNTFLEAAHPIFSAAAPIRDLSAPWMVMQPGAGWEVLAKGSDDGATALFRTEGRGFMLLTSFWGYQAPQLRNIWATLQYTRAGVLPQLPDLTALTYGNNTLTTSFRNLTAQPLTLRVRLGLADPRGATPEFAGSATAAAGAVGTAELSVPLPQRGAYDLSFSLQVQDGPQFAASRATVTLPPLVEIKLIEPQYRGVIMLAAPPARIRAEVALHPFGEELGGYYTATLRRGEQVLARTEPRSRPGDQFSFSLPFKNEGSGDCRLEVALLGTPQGQPLHTAARALPVLAPRSPQVFVDEDRNLRVDGKLFFPISLYHVPTKDFAAVKALGFNSLQAWGTKLDQARENLDAAQANGLKVILEGVTYAAGQGDLHAMDSTLQALQSHPALLSWYLTDEPSGAEKLAWCQRVYEYLQAKDPHHPVFMTSCSPREFARYAWVTDLFAVDPYPIPAAPVTMVSSWMQTAQEAVQGRKPVWLIPQLHNWAAYDGHPEKGRYPTPEEERNMVYQGLVWGAKAIFYYPWDDGSTGLVKDEKLRMAVGRINAELAQLGPELLTRRHTLTARDDGAHAGLFAAVYQGERGSYVIAVSVAAEARDFTVPTGALKPGTAEVLFEQRQVPVTATGLRDAFPPLGVHVYRLP